MNLTDEIRLLDMGMLLTHNSNCIHLYRSNKNKKEIRRQRSEKLDEQ
jgi:hypothetical protein